MSYNVNVWLHGIFFSLSSWVFVPCCKQSLEAGSKSSLFFSFHYWLWMWLWMSFNVRVTRVFHHSSSPSVIYILLCSLPIAVSIFVPVERSQYLFHSLDELSKVKAVYRSFERRCRCLTEMHVKQSHGASFQSDILGFFFPPPWYSS